MGGATAHPGGGRAARGVWGAGGTARPARQSTPPRREAGRMSPTPSAAPSARRARSAEPARAGSSRSGRGFRVGVRASFSYFSRKPLSDLGAVGGKAIVSGRVGCLNDQSLVWRVTNEQFNASNTANSATVTADLTPPPVRDVQAERTDVALVGLELPDLHVGARRASGREGTRRLAVDGGGLCRSNSLRSAASVPNADDLVATEDYVRGHRTYSTSRLGRAGRRHSSSESSAASSAHFTNWRPLRIADASPTPQNPRLQASRCSVSSWRSVTGALPQLSAGSFPRRLVIYALVLRQCQVAEHYKSASASRTSASAAASRSAVT